MRHYLLSVALTLELLSCRQRANSIANSINDAATDDGIELARPLLDHVRIDWLENLDLQTAADNVSIPVTFKIQRIPGTSGSSALYHLYSSAPSLNLDAMQQWACFLNGLLFYLLYAWLYTSYDYYTFVNLKLYFRFTLCYYS